MEKKRLRKYFWSIFGSLSFLVILLSFLLPKEQTYELKWKKIKEAESHPYSKLLKEYIRINTAQPLGNTRSSAIFLALLLEKEGIKWEIFESKEEKANLIAKIGPDKGTPIILHHHMDTAEVIDREKWKYDPWEGTIHLGQLYGIGAIDIKSMGLCFLYAFIKAHKENWNLKRPVVYYASCAEEATFEEGSKWMLENHPEYFPPNSTFLTEGGIVEMITNQVRWVGIEIGQKGYAWFNLKISEEEKEKLKEELKELFKDEPVLHPFVKTYIKNLANHRVDFFKSCLEDIENCIRGKKRKEIYIPNYLKNLMYSEGYWNRKKDGTWDFVISIRWGESLDDYVKRTEEIFKKYKLNYKLTKLPEANFSDPDTKEFEEIKNVFYNFFNVPVFYYIPPVSITEACLFREKGILAYGICPVRYTIFDSFNMNLYDERVYLPYYLDGLEISEKILKALATM